MNWNQDKDIDNLIDYKTHFNYVVQYNYYWKYNFLSWIDFENFGLKPLNPHIVAVWKIKSLKQNKYETRKPEESAS